MVIRVQLLVLNVKINYVDHKFILMVLHNLIYKYKHALVNKSFKVFLSCFIKKHTNIFKTKIYIEREVRRKRRFIFIFK
jgi:hypothetical protein